MYTRNEIYAAADKALERIHRQDTHLACICVALLMLMVAVRTFAPGAFGLDKTQHTQTPQTNSAPGARATYANTGQKL